MSNFLIWLQWTRPISIKRQSKTTMLVFNLQFPMESKPNTIETNWIEIILLKCIFQLSERNRAYEIHFDCVHTHTHTNSLNIEGTMRFAFAETAKTKVVLFCAKSKVHFNNSFSSRCALLSINSNSEVNICNGGYWRPGRQPARQ